MSYSAGTVFLEVVPVFRNFQRETGRKAREEGREAGRQAGEGFDEGFGDTAGKAVNDGIRDAARGAKNAGKREMEQAGEESGKNFSGAFRRALKRAGKEAVSGLGKEINNELDSISKSLRQLGDLEIGVDITSKEALAKLATLETALNSISRSGADIEVRMNAAAAAAELETFRRRVEAVDGLTAEVTLEVNEGSFQRKVKQAATKARAALRDMDFDVTPSLDLSDLNTRLAALYARLEALRDVEVGVDFDQEQVAREVTAVRREIETFLQRSDIDIETQANFTEALAELAPLASAIEALDGRSVDIDVDVHGAASAAAQLAALNQRARDSRNAGLDAANSFRAFSGIVFGLATVGPLIIPILASIVALLAAIGPAVAVAGVGIGGLILGFTGIGAAVGALNDAQKNSAKDSLQAGKSMRSAANAVRDAELAVARAREEAAQSARDAAEGVADAVDRQRKAEEELTEALEDQQRAQANLVRARVEAERQLAELSLRARGGALAERQATLDLARATSNRRRVFGGVEGEYSSADREEADIDFEQARIRLEQIRLDNQRIAEEQAVAARDGIESTQAMIQARDNLARADESVLSAQEQQADAAEAVRDAIENQERAARDSQRAITDALRRQSDAQLAYQDALQQTGDIGSSSMQKLREAMDSLGPAGQAFSIFLFGLKDEFFALRDALQEGLLPGVQDGITSLMEAYGPDLLVFMRELGVVLGDLFRDAAEGLKSPEWRAFFEMIGREGPELLRLWAGIMGNIGTAVAGILTAFAPFAVDFAEGLLEITEGWAAWAAELKDNPEFQDFVEYLGRIGPEVMDFLLAFAGALLNLAIGLAPYAEDLMIVLTAILGFIADMDPQTLGLIATAIIFIFIAVQSLFGIISLFFAGGVVVAAFSGLAAVIGGTAAAATVSVSLIVGAIVAGIALILGAFYLLYNNVEPFRNFFDELAMFALDFRNIFTNEYEGTLSKPFRTFKDTVVLLATIWTEKVAAIARDAGVLVSAIQAAYYDKIEPVLSAFTDALSGLNPAFAAAVSGIVQLWESLVNKLGTPVKFFIETILNDGIIKAFNTLARAVNIDTIDPIPVPKSLEPKTSRGIGYATGGYTGPGGKYEPAGIVHRDEYVLRKESTDKLRRTFGLDFLDYINRFGEIPGLGYASGGLVGFGRLLQSMGFRVSEHPAFGGVRGRHSRGSWHYRNGAIDVNYGPGGTSAIEQRAIDKIVPLADDYGLRTIWRVKDHFNHAHFDVGGGRNLLGTIAAGVNALFDSPVGLLTDTADALIGRIPGGGIMADLVGAVARKAVTALAQAVGGVGDFETENRPAYDTGGLVGGKPTATMYDNGGYLPPGLSTVLNLTGRPEPVLTDEQWRAVGAGGGGDTWDVDFNGVPTDPSEVVDVLMHKVRSMKRGGSRARRGGVG